MNDIQYKINCITKILYILYNISYINEQTLVKYFVSNIIIFIV